MKATRPFFTWPHVEAEIILLCIRWSLQEDRDLEGIMARRGCPVDYTTLSRWGNATLPG